MEPLFAFLLIVAFASAAHHDDPGSADRVPADATQEVQALPCPSNPSQPRIRDLTVPFDNRMYLLPSGETCRPSIAHNAQAGSSDGQPTGSTAPRASANHADPDDDALDG